MSEQASKAALASVECTLCALSLTVIERTVCFQTTVLV